ncbi:hypothetical protein TrST_g11375 [Triparma strigata]|uniref:Uncharacterized protein n=1 Tax=Triparma strigata TaxID=1606541 RepID=A0A9W7EFC1_9STRA|nr:hypothetical protein TrST_g11375 [Triparma strigata]
MPKSANNGTKHYHYFNNGSGIINNSQAQDGSFTTFDPLAILKQMRESNGNGNLGNVTSVSGISRGETGVDITLPSYADFSILSTGENVKDRSTGSPNRSPKASIAKPPSKSFHYFEDGKGFKGDRDKAFYNNHPEEWKSKNGGLKADSPDRPPSPPKRDTKRRVDWNAGSGSGSNNRNGSTKLSSGTAAKAGTKAAATSINPNTLSELTHLLSLKSDLPLSTPPELQTYIHKLESSLAQATMQVSRLSASLSKLEKQHEEFKNTSKEQIKKKDASISALRANNAKLRSEVDGSYTRESGDIGVTKADQNAKGYNSFSFAKAGLSQVTKKKQPKLQEEVQLPLKKKRNSLKPSLPKAAVVKKKDKSQENKLPIVEVDIFAAQTPQAKKVLRKQQQQQERDQLDDRDAMGGDRERITTGGVFDMPVGKITRGDSKPLRSAFSRPSTGKFKEEVRVGRGGIMEFDLDITEDF